ncbi:hypothetical protein HAX54_023607 [Datura stramonium]|uniref:Pentatricopeptide repeat-containing protein n=1 Tax=Datura stramonium TaxID=4076 RepID=A0ABS8UZG8_DATST|nr:hypothetical protein [Datura stramonium]
MLIGCLGKLNFKGDVPISNHEGSKELSLPRASNISFTSLPTMRLNEQATEILLKGHVFKALFCVDAYNRLEPIAKLMVCQQMFLLVELQLKTELITFFFYNLLQVEGDIVAVEVDPPSLWARMKRYTADSVIVESFGFLALKRRPMPFFNVKKSEVAILSQTIGETEVFIVDGIRIGLQPDVVTYNTWISAYCHSVSIDAGYSVFHRMKDTRINPDVITYNSLTAGATRYSLLSKCLNLFYEMIEMSLPDI